MCKLTHWLCGGRKEPKMLRNEARLTPGFFWDHFGVTPKYAKFHQKSTCFITHTRGEITYSDTVRPIFTQGCKNDSSKHNFSRGIRLCNRFGIIGTKNDAFLRFFSIFQKITPERPRWRTQPVRISRPRGFSWTRGGFQAIPRIKNYNTFFWGQVVGRKFH